jgi:hypothetical protein
MCCNIDSTPFFPFPQKQPHTNNTSVLFSVLVLHWITAPDNASTITPLSPTNNPHIRPGDPNSLPKKRMEPRPPLSQISSHEMGLSHYITRKPRVTTLVTAAKDENGVDLYHMRVPENAITVSRNTVRAVDELRIERGSSEKGSPELGRGSDTSASASARESLHRRSGSEDGLFCGKC